jgi:hypothetical protein
VVRIPSSLRGSVDFVIFDRYSHMTLGVEHVEIIMETTSHFWFGQNTLVFEWGIHEYGDGIYGLLLGLQTYNEILI